MSDIDDRDGALLIVNAVDDTVGAAACAVAIVQRRAESLAESVRIVEQGTDDELVRSECRSFGHSLGELAPSGGCDDKRVAVLTFCHTLRLRRSVIA